MPKQAAVAVRFVLEDGAIGLGAECALVAAVQETIVNFLPDLRWSKYIDTAARDQHHLYILTLLLQLQAALWCSQDLGIAFLLVDHDMLVIIVVLHKHRGAS